MPGKKRAKPKPSEFLIVAEPQMSAAWAQPTGKRLKIEAFPLVDGRAAANWVDLPPRKTVKEMATLALPQGAHPMPLYDPTGQPDLRPVRSSAGAQARLLMVGEGYPDNGVEQFFTACDRLSTAILATHPFDLVAGRIAIDGLFLPLRGSAVVNIGCSRTPGDLSRLRPTLFGTQCCLDGVTPHLWGGDEDRVRKLARKALSKKQRRLEDYRCLMVLIHSDDYGGAGSVESDEPGPRMAWATTGNPHSLNILLHELGHALGLQDEYERKQAEPAKPWRNISDFEAPQDTPWKDLATEPRDRLTLAGGLSWQGRPDAVGTFEGAGYKKTKRYRPSFDCRMRNLEADFCPVCSDHIRTQLDPHHAGHVGGEN